MMNIKKALKSDTIISMLITGFILAPSSALAERHYSKGKSHSDSSQKQYSNSRSHSQKSTRHNSHGKKYYGDKRHNSHRAPRYNGHGYKHTNVHYNGHNQHQYNYTPYYFPWNINSSFDHNGGFSIGYQDDHFGFTLRD